jgi:site-specific recombinase XerD
MNWEYWICLYTETHCTARGLRASTIAAYKATLEQLRRYVAEHQGDIAPEAVTARAMLEYVNHLRGERDNGDSSVNRTVTIVKNFYRAMVAMGYLDHAQNPMAHFPRMKGKPRKLPRTIGDEDLGRMLHEPPTNTILGLRDRAILALLAGTGIRASECATLKEGDVDLAECTILVSGKGGHERVLTMHDRVVDAMRVYRNARGMHASSTPFFASRTKKAMSRGAIYERVRTIARRARIERPASPHQLRHTFATQLVKSGANIQVVRECLGHRCISSTQIYLHVTAHDLKEAASNHPIGRLAPIVTSLVPKTKLPFQLPPRRRRA